MATNLVENLSNLSDAFQLNNGITDEGLIPPISTFALAIVDKNGRTSFNPNATSAGPNGGNGLRRQATAVFNPSANVNHQGIGAHGLGVFIPKNAVVIGMFYDVITTLTSATDAATVALMLQAAGDALAAIAISDASNVLDAGLHAGKLGYPNFGADAAHDTQVEVAALFAASMLKLTAQREITATVAVEALTAGKVNIWFEYVLSN